MRKVRLYGALAKKYGSEFTLRANTVGQAVSLLEANFPGFQRSLLGGQYRVVAGKSLEDEKGIVFTDELVKARLNLGSKDLHIMPVPEGAGGVGRIVLGAALIFAAFYFAPAVVGALGPTQGLSATAFSVGSFGVSYQSIAMFGASLVLGGVSQLLTPTPKVGDYSGRESPDQRASFLFNGAVNTVEQGGPVTVIYGRMRTGSFVMSGSIVAEELPQGT